MLYKKYFMSNRWKTVLVKYIYNYLIINIIIIIMYIT